MQSFSNIWQNSHENLSFWAPAFPQQRKDNPMASSSSQLNLLHPSSGLWSKCGYDFLGARDGHKRSVRNLQKLLFLMHVLKKKHELCGSWKAKAYCLTAECKILHQQKVIVFQPTKLNNKKFRKQCQRCISTPSHVSSTLLSILSS